MQAQPARHLAWPSQTKMLAAEIHLMEGISIALLSEVVAPAFINQHDSSSLKRSL
jgi:hypothetical protein